MRLHNGLNLETEVFSSIRKLDETGDISDAQLLTILNVHEQAPVREELARRARKKAEASYGKNVYTRGLIEFTNYCKNDCYYCGIRASNQHTMRYRLNKDDILSCCDEGYHLGFRTFVLQGGEDPYFSDDHLCDIVSTIHKQYPDCAITLSIGERSKESYQRLYQAGVNRYLLRHETYHEAHYQKLHPSYMSAKHRQQCLMDLKEIGFQTGTGIMVGSPYQTLQDIVADLRFIKTLAPHMVGIGPFIPASNTVFSNEKQGSLELTVTLLSIIRLLLPHVLLPSTTALGTIDKQGREKGILAGANVVMPNLSPLSVRKKYRLYDNKICTGDESAQCLGCLQKRMQCIGYTLSMDRGDFKSNRKEEITCIKQHH